MRQGKATDTFLDFDVGDFVVHADHGIGKFAGLALLRPRRLPGLAEPPKNEREEYLTLEFAGGTKLHVPCVQIGRTGGDALAIAGEQPVAIETLRHAFESWLPDYMAGKT